MITDVCCLTISGGGNNFFLVLLFCNNVPWRLAIIGFSEKGVTPGRFLQLPLGVNFCLLIPCRAICWSYLKQGEGGGGGGVRREPSAQLTFMVMGRRPCKYGVYQQAWGFPLLNIEAKPCLQSVWHHRLHVRCQCFMTRAFWLNLAGGIYWDSYYLLMPLNILHYATVHERVCLCTHFVRTHVMKELLLECSVQTPLAGVSWAKRRGGQGEVGARGQLEFMGAVPFKDGVCISVIYEYLMVQVNSSHL